MSDLQALLWYQEKQLYKNNGMRDNLKVLEGTDYENEAAKFAAGQKGYTKHDTVERVLRRGGDRGFKLERGGTDSVPGQDEVEVCFSKRQPHFRIPEETSGTNSTAT